MSFFETLTNIIAAALVWVFAGYLILRIIRTGYQILTSDGED